jgi:hypothetical protein
LSLESMRAVFNAFSALVVLLQLAPIKCDVPQNTSSPSAISFQPSDYWYGLDFDGERWCLLTFCLAGTAMTVLGPRSQSKSELHRKLFGYCLQSLATRSGLSGAMAVANQMAATAQVLEATSSTSVLRRRGRTEATIRFL